MVNMKIRFIIAVFLTLYSQMVLSNSETEPKRVVVEHWPPWEIALDKKKEIVSGGLAVKLVEELMKRIEEPIVFVTVPWKRALLEIKNGRSDLVPMVAKTEEREKYMIFTVPIYNDSILLAYSVNRLGSFRWDNWEDLKPYRFQLVRGYSYGREWNEAQSKYNYNISNSTNDAQSLKMLMHGRIDLTPLFFVNGTQLINDLEYSGLIKFAEKPIKETTFYFGISKKSQLASRVDELNSAITAMKEDGTFKEILGTLYRN